MCNPMVIPVVVGAAVGVASSIKKGQSETATAVANAQLAKQSAGAALQQGVVQASSIGMQMRQAQATALAASGASGADTTAGTAGNQQALSAVAGAADIEQARYNATMRAWGFESEEADWYRKKEAASGTMISGIGGSVIGAMGGAASALTKGK